MDYVELNRTFVDAHEDAPESEFDSLFEAEARGRGGKPWAEILKHRFVLILGTAGVGKTTELHQQAKRLVAVNQAAFFLRLDDIAKGDVRAALNGRDRGRFDAWLASGDQAVFFLDSVDEAKLEAYRGFNRALNKFVTAVETAAARVNVVLSCRHSDWKHVTDLESVKGALLPLAQAKRATGASLLGPVGEDSADEAMQLEEVEDDSDVELAIVQLKPLDRAQIVKLAKALRLTDAELFVSALAESESLFMAATPRDIDWLVAYWTTHRKIGTLWDMMSTSVEEKLREQNPAHLAKDTLPPDLSKIGAEQIAGANFLCRETNVLIDDPALGLRPAQPGIDPSKLLTDFGAPLLKNLLNRPIFSEVYAGRVRIDPKQNRSFLAALWLLRLLEKGAPRRRILSLLVGSVYGKEKAITSMIEIAGWVGARDSGIRAHLIRVVPEAVLFLGDPALIPVQERIEAIRSFARIYTCGARFDWIVNDIDYARAADPAMDGPINDMLADRTLSFDTFKLLLRFTAIGKLPKSAATAARLALEAKVSSSIRVWAIDAVAQAGNATHRGELRAAILKGDIAESRLLERASRELFPGTLSLDDLVALIDLFEIEHPEAIGGPPHTIAHYWAEACPPELLPEFLRRLVDKVTTPPLKTDAGFDPLLSARFFWLIEAVARVTRLTITRGAATDAAHKATVVKAIALVEAAKNAGFRVLGDDDIEEALREHQEDRRAYLVHKILIATERFWLRSLSFARPTTGDVAHVLARAKEATDPDTRAKLTIGAVEVWAWSGRAAEERDALVAAVEAAALSDELRGEARRILNPRPMEPDREWEDEQRQRRAAEARVRADSKARIEANIARLRDGSDFAAIYYLVKEMRRGPTASNASWAQTNIAFIETEYGKPLADAFRQGLSRSWRRYAPPLKSTLENRSAVENGVLTGLTALALAFRDGEDFAALSPEDTAVATRYALRELNQFPRWLTVMAESKPDVVAPILLAETIAQLGARDYRQADIISLREISRVPALARIVGPGVLAALPELPVIPADALSDVLSILDAAKLVDTERGKTAAGKTKTLWTSNLSAAVVWLRDWMRFAPHAATDFLEKALAKMRAQAPAAMAQFLLRIQDDIRNSESGAYLRDIHLLKRLIPQAYKYLPMTNDPEHVDGVVYDVTPDEDARETRDRLAALVETIDGMEAHDALRDLAAHPDLTELKEGYTRALERHSARAVEIKPWTVEAVRQFAANYTHDPETACELFEVVCDRLSDFKESIERDDFGDRGIFKPGINESELQRFYAGRFDRESRRRYDVVREPEVANDKKPDIRLSNPKAGLVSVEIKPLDGNRYSFESLKDTISTQLVGQYMKASRSRHGILLLCLLEPRTWRVGGRRLDFNMLIAELNEEAKRIESSHVNVERVVVFGIDMTPWKPAKRRKMHTAKVASKAKRKDEVMKFEQRHAEGSKARLALALLLYTGVRRSDVVKLGRQMESNGSLRFRQVKTEKWLTVPILPELRAELDRHPSNHLTFLVTEYGHPFSAAGFGNWFHDRCAEAGLKKCSAHGLRKAGATRAANNGATSHQLKAVFGWSELSEAERYTRSADQKRLAESGISYLSRERKVDE